MSRRYNKLGLRRDLNFTDIPNKETALNNLLNGLVDVDGESFISQDLDALRNISNTTITNADFLKINGLALKVTQQDGGSTTEVAYKPIVKIKNRLKGTMIHLNIVNLTKRNSLYQQGMPI